MSIVLCSNNLQTPRDSFWTVEKALDPEPLITLHSKYLVIFSEPQTTIVDSVVSSVAELRVSASCTASVGTALRGNNLVWPFAIAKGVSMKPSSHLIFNP